jgi:hypothetical protein
MIEPVVVKESVGFRWWIVRGINVDAVYLAGIPCL